MATGYHLRLGYMSDRNESGRDDAWKQFIDWVAMAREQGNAIANETMRIEPTLNSHDVWQVAKTFGTDETDCTVTVIDTEDDRQVMLMASGYGEFRKLKEATRRAFCRMAMEAMHTLGIELSLSVS